MPIQSSFPTVADQIVLYNKNVIEVLSAINSLSTTQEPSINVNVYSTEGVLTSYNLPSFTYLKSEIDRLNRSINSLYSIDNSNGTMIQPTNKNKFKKVISVDLNQEPNNVGDLGTLTKFKSDTNYFLDTLLNPALSVELDLSNKIQNNVDLILGRRYIVNFQTDSSGNLTTDGSSALNAFNSLYNQVSNINYNSFNVWYQTTPGVVDPLHPLYDEREYSLEPNVLLYSGLFTAKSVYLDSLNKKLWYNMVSLNYTIVSTQETISLKVGDQLSVNTDEITSTRYNIIEIDNTSSQPRIRFETLEGLQPIPVGIAGGLKIYSPVLYTKKIKIPVGYNERSVVFVRPLNRNNILSQSWSLGSGFYTNNLVLSQNGPDNGKSFEAYYTSIVDDYGRALKELVSKNKPVALGQIPAAPTLDPNSFKVVQTNIHLTDTPDSNLLKNKHNYQQGLKSELQQIDEAIGDRNKKLKVTRFTSQAAKNQFDLELSNLQNQKDSKSSLFASTTQEIIDLSRQPITNTKPQFALRGLWNIPAPATSAGTEPQKIVQFEIQYRRLSKDGKETPIETYKMLDNSGNPLTAVYSNWVSIKTHPLERTFDSKNGVFSWSEPNVTSGDEPTINQLSIQIVPNEKLEIRIRSISEVGFPDSPLVSPWSETITKNFPDDLNNVLNQNDYIITQANKDDVQNQVINSLNAKGLDNLLKQQIVVNNQTYNLSTDTVITDFKDTSGVAIGLQVYLKQLTDKIAYLEEKIANIKGVLQLTILRNNQEFVVSNGSDTTFNVECEDYMDKFTGSGIPTGRVYQNNVYVIKDFIVRVSNVAVNSPLGLLSNRTYLGNPQIYNTSVPQAFWVDDQDELILSNVSGETRTQLDNQFLWSINYDTIDQTTVTKLSENIGNNFNTVGNNSITPVLSTSEYNVGYSEAQILNFVGNNLSLLDSGKWIDSTVSVGSTTKLLSTVNPVISNLTKIQETNYNKVHVVNSGKDNDIIIPLNIYFKLNALDTSQTGANYQYINLNNATQTVQHVKKLKFFLENEADNRPFIFTINFNINRNKITIKKNLTYTNIIK